MKLSRRHFLATAGLAAAAASVPAPFVWGAPGNKKYRTALVGCGWWGGNILHAALATNTIDPVALVEVDRRHLEQTRQKLGEVSSATPKLYSDYRDMLEEIKPEIVINATPDHWHPLITIDANRAGAHVYVEKPVSHTILEGAAMVKAARATGRKVQVGTHRRVSPANMAAMEFMKEGKLGKIGMIRAFVHYQGGHGTPIPDTDVPDYLDWDMWCGPAPLLPFNPRMHPKGFRAFLELANGQLGDWGVHWMDQVNWWAGDNVMPKMVASSGGRFINRDNTDVPDTMNTVFQFDDFVLEWEHRQYAGNGPEHHNVGCYFYGTNGVMHIGWLEGATYYPVAMTDAKPEWHVPHGLHEPDGQNIHELWVDFIESIESDRLPVCDIDKGYRSTVFSLLGMLSLKIGRSVRWDHEKLCCIDDPQADKLLKREYRKPWVYPEV